MAFKLPVDTCIDLSLVSARCITSQVVSIVVIDVVVNDISVRVDVPVTVVNINISIYVRVDVSAVHADPAASGPAVVIGSRAVVAVIIVVAVEPRADRKARAKSEGTDRDSSPC